MENTHETSKDAKRNAFYLHCSVTEQYRPYAVCLHLCQKRKEGRLPEIYSDCSVAIGKKRCPALSMRAEEKESGRALYFIERVKLLGGEFMARAKELLVSTPAKPEPSKSQPMRKSSVINTGGYADAINEAIKTKAVAAPTAPAIKIEALPGESPLEMARRLLAANKENQQ